MLFRTQGNAGFVSGTNSVDDGDSWGGLFDAGDPTLIVRSPNLASVEIGDAEVIESDENYKGDATLTGLRGQEVTAMIHNAPPEVIKTLEAITCSSDYLEVAFIYENDQIHLLTDGEATQTHTFIPISPETFIVTPPSKTGELGSKYIANMRFKIPASWFANSEIVSPVAPFSYVRDAKIGWNPTP